MRFTSHFDHPSGSSLCAVTSPTIISVQLVTIFVWSGRAANLASYRPHNLASLPIAMSCTPLVTVGIRMLPVPSVLSITYGWWAVRYGAAHSLRPNLAHSAFPSSRSPAARCGRAGRASYISSISRSLQREPCVPRGMHFCTPPRSAQDAIAQW